MPFGENATEGVPYSGGRRPRTVQGYFAVILCWLIVGRCQAAGGDAVADVTLWDTQRVAGSGDVDFARKQSWRQVAAGAARSRCRATW